MKPNLHSTKTKTTLYLSSPPSFPSKLRAYPSPAPPFSSTLTVSEPPSRKNNTGMKEYWTSFASLLGVLAFCQTLVQLVFPPQLRFASLKLFNRIFNSFSCYCYFDITEIDGVNTNELYNAVQLYLSSAVSISGSRLSLTRSLNSTAITFGLTNNDSIFDTFNGVTIYWEHVVTQRQPQTFSWRPLPEEKRGFTLRIKKKDKSLILDEYLDYIMDKANDIRRRNQNRLLYTNSRGNPWESVPFKHPSTFDTLAMDPLKKQEIMEDLKDFANGQSFYQKTGRAWKRGYLLYGPPGTGKSSMIAAMSNYLGYDIYDLELTEVHKNSELRKLLMKTTSKSIIVIEDIDCSINLSNRKNKNDSISNYPMGGGERCYFDQEIRSGSRCNNGEEGGNSITLSGLLNFTDGLWSCCGSERIFVFTTNHIEKLDPALLRSGRMDMHIFMSYCSFPALKILLKNYLGCDSGEEEEQEDEDELLKEIEKVIVNGEMTPADVSEVLIKNRNNNKRALSELLGALKERNLKKKKNIKGGLMETINLSNIIEDEEQEKRALESPREGCGCQVESSNGDDDDEKKVK